MQQAADRLNAWQKIGASLSTRRNPPPHYSHCRQTEQKAGTIRLGGTPLREDEEATYLGVTFDRRQTWKPHIAQAETKARRKLAILRKLAGTTDLGSEREDTEDSIPGNNQTPPRVRLHSVVNLSQDKPADPRPCAKPGPPTHHWCNEIHAHQGNGEAYHHPTPLSEKRSQDYGTGREAKVPTRPPHEAQTEQPHQEPAQTEQFCTREQETFSTVQGSPPTEHSTSDSRRRGNPQGNRETRHTDLHQCSTCYPRRRSE
ncbi:hypothetical protein V1264_020112 [Littorina saxatilis]|uniref:Uncharacterized protein n=1 Tax=Littorina saxatilis TaxID=31220 RepID=A0AAN9B9H1_9CAEN